MQRAAARQAVSLFWTFLLLCLGYALAPRDGGIIAAIVCVVLTLAVALAALRAVQFVVTRFRVAREARLGGVASVARLALSWLVVGAGLAIAASFAPFPQVRAIGQAVSGVMLSPIPDAATGEFEAQGPGIGNWKMTVDSCASGERRQYFGAVLYSSANDELAVKVVKPPIGPARLSINVPGTDHANIYDKEDCTVLDVALQRGSGKFNGIWNVYGHLTFDCRFNLDHVWGQATLNYCH